MKTAPYSGQLEPVDRERRSDTLLSVKSLNVYIGATQILHDVNFQLEAGKTLGIIGESGSGKSITALSLVQLLPPAATITGQIMLAGKNLLELEEAQMCDIRGNGIGMIFQEPMTALNPLKTIGDQVMETALMHRNMSRSEARHIAIDTLNKVELPVSQFPLSRYPHQLSGGQRQRVVIAMAIIMQPALLIADEPTTALDVTTQAQILEMLLRLVRDEHMSLLLITHDLAVVSGIADRVAIMRDGRILDSGMTDDLFSKLDHPYTRQLFDASSHVPERFRSQDEISRQAGEADSDRPLLSVDSLVRKYPIPAKGWFGKPSVFTAVDNVSFTIRRGESVGLVGESGCGKSTLARAILGLDQLQHGSVSVDGSSVIAGEPMSRELRRKVQVVFQDPYSSFNPRHRVWRLVSEPMHLLDSKTSQKQRRSRVAGVLDSVGLESKHMDRYIHEFSGGQRQRIAIARALIIQPALIVLDEAVSALDVSVRAQILDLLAGLVDKYELSYLFISHDLGVVRNITDRVLVMQQGRIVESGRTGDVFENPQQSYTRALIASIPEI